MNVTHDKPATDPFNMPLEKKTEMSNKWDDIRKQSRKAHSPTSGERGISYDDLRLRNRANQGNYNSLTPEEEAEFDKVDFFILMIIQSYFTRELTHAHAHTHQIVAHFRINKYAHLRIHTKHVYI